MSKKVGAPKGNKNAVGNSGGRPKSPHKRKNLVIMVDNDAEYQAIIDHLTPRQRTEILMKYVRTL